MCDGNDNGARLAAAAAAAAVAATSINTTDAVRRLAAISERRQLRQRSLRRRQWHQLIRIRVHPF